jgi:hypothetical protein
MKRWLIVLGLTATLAGVNYALAAETATPSGPVAPAVPGGRLAPLPPPSPAGTCLAGEGPMAGPHGKFRDGPRREARVIRTEGPLMPVMAMVIPVVMFLCIAAVIIVAIMFAHGGRVQRYKLVEQALASGKEVPADLLVNGHGRRDPLGGGLILVALGVGLSVALGVVAGPAQAVWGLIPFLIGVALLITIPLRKRMKNGD